MIISMAIWRDPSYCVCDIITGILFYYRACDHHPVLNFKSFYDFFKWLQAFVLERWGTAKSKVAR